MKAAVAPDLSDYTFTPDLTQAGTLPARWYTDPAFLTLENEHIFAKTWQPVGRAEMVLRPGDFFTCELAGEPLVITRDKAGILRGFYNVCRHRAGPVASGKGNRKSLQCRYHGWTYGLDGRLLNAPDRQLAQRGYLPSFGTSGRMGAVHHGLLGRKCATVDGRPGRY